MPTPAQPQSVSPSTSEKTLPASHPFQLQRIGVVMEPEPGNPAEIHKRLRDPHTGRINPRNLQHPYPVDASALRALKRDLLKRVGELAAGWNAGAQKLGVTVVTS